MPHVTIPPALHLEHTLCTQPKPHAPCEAKSPQELGWLLDVLIRRLEDKVTSSSHGNPQQYPAQCSSPPGSLLSHSRPLPCGLSCGPADCGPANLRVNYPSNPAMPQGSLLSGSVPLPYGRSCGPAHHGPEDFGTSPSHALRHNFQRGKVIRSLS